MDQNIIGSRLRALRGDMSQAELGRALGLSDSAIGMYEQGNRIPKDDIKNRYAEFFGKTVQEIFFDTE